jgi:hypothetical protein
MAAARLGRSRISSGTQPPHAGTLFEPMAEGTGAHGGWHTGHARSTGDLAFLAAAALAALPLGLLALARRSRT